MPLVDDDGRLFGVVNLIDAIVLVFVVSAVVAGVFLVVLDGERTTDPDAPSHMTVIFEPQLEGLEPEVTPGDRVSIADGPGGMNVTDVFRTPGRNGTVVTVAKVAIGPGAEAPKAGPRHRFETESYAINGTIRQFSNQSTLRIEQTDVRFSATVSESRLDRVQRDGTLRIGTEAVGQVESASAYPIDNASMYRIGLGVSLPTVRIDGYPMYGGQPVRPGVQHPLYLENGTVAGVVDSVGRLEPVGESTPTTVVVSLEGVSATRSDALTVGLNESHLGTPAMITDLSSSPASTVLTTDSGEFVTTPHPTQRDISLVLAVEGRRLGDHLYFHDAPLRIGRVVTLDFGHIRVRGTVVDFDGD